MLVEVPASCGLLRSPTVSLSARLCAVAAPRTARCDITRLGVGLAGPTLRFSPAGPCSAHMRRCSWASAGTINDDSDKLEGTQRLKRGSRLVQSFCLSGSGAGLGQIALGVLALSDDRREPHELQAVWLPASQQSLGSTALADGCSIDRAVAAPLAATPLRPRLKSALLRSDAAPRIARASTRA